MGFRGIRYELGQCLLTEYLADGTLAAQHDGLGRAPQVKASEVLHPLGFAARPRSTDTNPDGTAKGGGGCKLRIGYDGDELQVEFVGDQRALAGIPPLGEGDSVQYAHTADGAPSFHVIKGEDGTQTIYVEVGESAHVLTIGRDGNGEEVLEFTHSRGMALTFFRDKSVLKNRTGNCYAELNDSGGILNGNWKVTGAFDVGATSFPLTKHPELAAAMTAVAATMNALNADPALLPSTKAAASAAVGLLEALVSAGGTTMTKGF
jgi:hypothetical protein